MASAADILTVRQNTDESTAEDFDDVAIGDLIDELGVNGASARVWRIKEGKAASYVDVSEAGASHAFGTLQDKAKEMAELYESAASSESATTGPRVTVIERE